MEKTSSLFPGWLGHSPIGVTPREVQFTFIVLETNCSCSTKTTLLPSYATPPFLTILSNVLPQDRDGPKGDYNLVGPSSPEGSTVGPRVLSHNLV